MTYQLTQEQVESIINESMADIKEHVISEAKRKIEYTIADVIAVEVKDVVQTFFRDEIKDDLKTSLVASKETIIKAAIDASQDIAVSLAKAMTSALTENLANGYTRGKIFKEMFD